VIKRTHEEFNDDFDHLRSIMDGDDKFMVGHQIRKERTAPRNRVVPTWTLDNDQVQKVIIRAWPLWQTNGRQRQGAARWAGCINAFWRMRLSASQVAQEGIPGLETPEQVKNCIKIIRRVARGRTANNRKIRGLRKVGRPRKDQLGKAA
jgi:hypothetical protein